MGPDRSCGHRGAVSCHAPSLTFERSATWCDAAELGLARALGDYAEEIRAGVRVGRMELWRIDGHSWAVTEVRNGVLIAWCYEGRQVKRFAQVLFAIARGNGLDTIEFTTPHVALGRLVRPLGFEPVCIEDGYLYRYQATVQ